MGHSFVKGSRLKVFDQGKVIDEIIVNDVREKIITAKNNVTKEEILFGFVEETNSWHVLFEGAEGEYCYNYKLPYTLSIA